MRVLKLFLLTFAITCRAQYETNLPPHVRQVLSQQLQDYFGSEGNKGVPVLDSAVNWNLFEKWPDDFVHHGKHYRLKLTGSGGDVIWDIASRSEVAFTPNFSAKYGDHFNGLAIYGGWVNRRKWEVDVSLDGKRVFGMQFYQNGTLFSFYYDEKKSGIRKTEYFDCSGTRIGSDVNGKYEWQGREVSSVDFRSFRTAILAACNHLVRPAEPSGPANGSQPLMPDSKSTPRATGSRR